jgi:thiol-disulfide isomerase/thioredoxin
VKLSRRAFLGGTLLLAACRADDGPAPIVGRTAPDFTADNLTDGKQNLSALFGKPIVLNFWATWCVPCKQELPAFQKLAGERKELQFLLVDVSEEPDDVGAFLKDLGISLPAVVDRTGEIVKAYRVRALPSTFFIGPDAKIKMAQLGALDENLLNQGISKIV